MSLLGLLAGTYPGSHGISEENRKEQYDSTGLFQQPPALFPPAVSLRLLQFIFHEDHSCLLLDSLEAEAELGLGMLVKKINLESALEGRGMREAGHSGRGQNGRMR